MNFFVFPERWIRAAIVAAVAFFGGIGHTVHIAYRNLPHDAAGQAVAPATILIDKRPRSAWPREKAQCLIAHSYGHLAGRRHSSNPRSIMYPAYRPGACHRWLTRHLP
jgi:hypothetical protein